MTKRSTQKLAVWNLQMHDCSALRCDLENITANHSIELKQLVVCPPTLQIGDQSLHSIKNVRIGAQDCHGAPFGPHTGSVSAKMLSDIGASHVILGHSDRRSAYDESDRDVLVKTIAAWHARLVPIVCLKTHLDDLDARSEIIDVTARINVETTVKRYGYSSILEIDPVMPPETTNAEAGSTLQLISERIRKQVRMAIPVNLAPPPILCELNQHTVATLKQHTRAYFDGFLFSGPTLPRELLDLLT